MHASGIWFSAHGCFLPTIPHTQLCEMVSVLVSILLSLISVESMSWRQFLPLPHSLLVHYLTHPLARLTLEILFIAFSGFSSAGPIRSISAPFEERITNISPLQPQTPHVQWHQWIPLMCQDEYVCECFFFFLKINLCVFLVCCVWPELLLSLVHCFFSFKKTKQKMGELVFKSRYIWPNRWTRLALRSARRCLRCSSLGTQNSCWRVKYRR